MTSLDDFSLGKLDLLGERGLKRHIHVTERTGHMAARRDGREMISFCCNDYLNFTHHSKVKQAAKAAIDKYGTGAGASRLITGNHPLIRELEQRLARMKGSEDACIFGSGYMANMGIIPTFVGQGDVIFMDELCHASLRAGASLTFGKVIFYDHNDMAHLKQLLEQHRNKHPRAMIITDGVFSMDGDLAPLDELARLARDYDGWLMSDDAHGLGVIGKGYGSRHMFDPQPDIPFQMGTLSKAIGSYGGYLCASRPVIDLIKTRARSLIYSTALPPASVAAALTALEIIEQEPDYCARPMQHARLFARLLNLPQPQSPIIPIIVGDTDRVMQYAAALENDGFLVTGIRPPTVAEGTARLRFTFSATHQEKDILRLTDAIRKHGILS